MDDRPGRDLVSALNQCRITYTLSGEPVVDKFANAGHGQKYKNLQQSFKDAFKAQELVPYNKPQRPQVFLLVPWPCFVMFRLDRIKNTSHNFTQQIRVRLLNRLLMYCAGMTDEEYEPILQKAYKVGDGKKWEKLATLGEALNRILPACMEPYGNGGTG